MGLFSRKNINMIEHVCVFSKKHIEKQKLQNIRIRIMRFYYKLKYVSWFQVDPKVVISVN